jgi:hypothetical protein
VPSKLEQAADATQASIDGVVSPHESIYQTGDVRSHICTTQFRFLLWYNILLLYHIAHSFLVTQTFFTIVGSHIQKIQEKGSKAWEQREVTFERLGRRLMGVSAARLVYSERKYRLQSRWSHFQAHGQVKIHELLSYGH